MICGVLFPLYIPIVYAHDMLTCIIRISEYLSFLELGRLGFVNTMVKKLCRIMVSHLYNNLIASVKIIHFLILL